MEKKKSLDLTGDTFLSWLTLIVLVAAVGLLGLLSYRILKLQNYMIEFSNHLDEHLTEAIGSIEKEQISYQPFIGEINIEGNPIKGNLDQAEIVIVEFSDFECPYCAQTTALMETILSDNPNFALIHKDYPLPNHTFAPMAAVAARCAGDQNKYWEMYGLLFQDQSNLDEESLKDRAQVLGLDEKIFDTCLTSSSPREKVEADFEQGLKMKIDSTPTFLVGKITLDKNIITMDGYLVTMNDLTGAIELAKRK